MGRKLTGRALAAWEKSRDLNSELAQTVGQMKPGAGARKTEFHPLPDGSIRRIMRRRDGTVEKDQVIPSARAPVEAARAATGLSQAAFACRCAHSRNGNRAGRPRPGLERRCCESRHDTLRY